MTAERDDPVQAVQVKPRYRRGSFIIQVQPVCASARKSCFLCGSDRHLANSPQCPAAKVHSNLCNKKGHFARVCSSAPTGDVHEVQVNDVVPKKLCYEVTVNTSTSSGTIIQFIVDTGSSVSYCHFRYTTLQCHAVVYTFHPTCDSYSTVYC